MSVVPSESRTLGLADRREGHGADRGHPGSLNSLCFVDICMYLARKMCVVYVVETAHMLQRCRARAVVSVAKYTPG